MYPKNAASPPRIAVGAVVAISDGAVQTSGVSVKVMPEGGSASAGGGTVAYEEGIVHYVPTQAETNYSAFMVIAYKAGCIPAAVTIVTTASSTAGNVIVGDKTGFQLAADQAVNVTKVNGTAQTAGDLAALLALVKAKTDDLTFTVAGQVDANSLSVGGDTPITETTIADAVAAHATVSAALANMDAAVSDVPTAAENATAAAAAVLVTPAQKIMTDADGHVAADMQKINAVPVTGDGSAGDKFDVV
jgi:hypothetical protein